MNSFAFVHHLFIPIVYREDQTIIRISIIIVINITVLSCHMVDNIESWMIIVATNGNCRRIFIFIGEFIFSIGELLVFIGENQ